MNANMKETKICSAFSSIGYRTLSENRCETHQEFGFGLFFVIFVFNCLALVFGLAFLPSPPSFPPFSSDGKCAVSELFSVLGVLKRALEG